MKALLAPLKKQPNLRQLIDDLEAFWQDEQNRRLDFYNWVTPDFKAEFIEGEIVVHSPVVKKHNVITVNLTKILSTYNYLHNLGFLGVEKIMCRFNRNDYEPDLCFFLSENHPEFRDDQTIFPVPDLIIEILSKSTEHNDRGVKFQDYQMHGVTEYWIIDPDAESVEQYINQNNKFHLQSNLTEGSISCLVLQGLIIPIGAFFDSNENHQFIAGLSV
jgi:Uma2 family endonuclease